MDWDWLAGAECADDGRLPMIGDVTIADETKAVDAVMVVGKSGIDIIWQDDADEHSWMLAATFDMSMLVADKLEGRAWSLDYLMKLGFKILL
jgi:hypothetical protein